MSAADSQPGGNADVAGLSGLAEPATIAQAAQRAGVHPNTIRRLVRTGRLRGVLMKGRHGDTWLVDAAELQRIVGEPRRQAGAAQENGPAVTVSAAAVSSAAASVDLSLDRARALERYTHGLLSPLVELLREREAAIESREALIRSQAARIGRLEREVELLRARPAVPPAAAAAAAGTGTVAAGPDPAPAVTLPVTLPSASAEEAASSFEHEAPPLAEEDPEAVVLPERVAALAGQMDRLRSDLRQIAAVLEGNGTPDAPVVAAEPPAESRAEPPAGPPVELFAEPDAEPPAELVTEPVAELPAEAEATEPAAFEQPADGQAPELPDPATLSADEIAGLFPTGRSSRFALGPLEPLEAPEADGLVEADSSEEVALTPEPAPPGLPGPPAPLPGAPPVAAGGQGAAAEEEDPFARAEAAVAELRRVLAPSGESPAASGASAVPASAAGTTAAPTAAAGPEQDGREAAPAPRRRPWWMFW